MSDETVKIEVSGESEAKETLNDAVEIAEKIVNKAEEIARTDERKEHQLHDVMELLSRVAIDNAASHATIIDALIGITERLDSLEVTAIDTAIGVLDVAEEVEELKEETEDVVEDVVEEIAEEVAVVADEIHDPEFDVPEKRTRKRRFI